MTPAERATLDVIHNVGPSLLAEQSPYYREAIHAELRAAGVIVVIVRSVLEARDFLRLHGLLKYPM